MTKPIPADQQRRAARRLPANPAWATMTAEELADQCLFDLGDDLADTPETQRIVRLWIVQAWENGRNSAAPRGTSFAVLEARVAALESLTKSLRPIGPPPPTHTPNLSPRRMEAIRQHLERLNRTLNGETAAETGEEGQREGESDADDNVSTD